MGAAARGTLQQEVGCRVDATGGGSQKAAQQLPGMLLPAGCSGSAQHLQQKLHLRCSERVPEDILHVAGGWQSALGRPAMKGTPTYCRYA